MNIVKNKYFKGTRKYKLMLGLGNYFRTGPRNNL